LFCAKALTSLIINRTAHQPWGIAVGYEIPPSNTSQRVQIRRIAANTPVSYSSMKVGDCLVSVNGIHCEGRALQEIETYFSSINTADICFVRNQEIIDLASEDNNHIASPQFNGKKLLLTIVVDK